jgi:CheY-like chemotaxis protein
MKYKILAIDDDEFNLSIIEDYFDDSSKYELLTASDGLEGLVILHELGSSIDVILLDRMMPNIDGSAFLKEMAKIPDFASIPVIIQSALGQEHQKKEMMERGQTYYLAKPYTEREIVSMTEEVLREAENHKYLIDEYR